MGEYILSRYLDTNGDGSGEKNAIGDYLTEEQIFFIQPPPEQTYKLKMLIVVVGDRGGMKAAEYGNLGGPLLTGITVRFADNYGARNDLTDGVPVVDNAHWGMICYDVDLKSWGPGEEYLLARWTVGEGGRIPRLRGNRGERLEFVLNDDFTGLITHRFFVQGYRY